MTSITLLLWIVSGLLLQLVIYLSIVNWRHWKNYQALPSDGDTLNPNIAADKFKSTEKGNLTDRLDFQSFKVDRKVIENTSGSICSFYFGKFQASCRLNIKSYAAILSGLTTSWGELFWVSA